MKWVEGLKIRGDRCVFINTNLPPVGGGGG